MAKYLIGGNYVGEGVKGLMKEGGTGRSAAISKLVESWAEPSKPSTTPLARPTSS